MKLLSFDKTKKQLTLLLQSVACLMIALLAGCTGTNLPASVTGGECKIFERPQYVVKGKASYDQNWINGNIEAGVGGCGWARPAARPASVEAGTIPAPPAPPKVSRARRVMNALRHPIKTFKKPVAKQPEPAPILSVPARPLTPGTFDPPAAPTLPAPPPKRSPIDELLSPK